MFSVFTLTRRFSFTCSGHLHFLDLFVFLSCLSVCFGFVALLFCLVCFFLALLFRYGLLCWGLVWMFGCWCVWLVGCLDAGLFGFLAVWRFFVCLFCLFVCLCVCLSVSVCLLLVFNEPLHGIEQPRWAQIHLRKFCRKAGPQQYGRTGDH